jgi:hypothetical protein
VYPWLSWDLAALITACTFDVGAVPPLVPQRPATMLSAPV